MTRSLTTTKPTWCASENVGSRRVLEKAGMKLLGTEKVGLVVGNRVYDKLVYEYKTGEIQKC